MDKAELVQLIISRSPKLRSLRDQTANANEYISRYQVKRSDFTYLPCCICLKIVGHKSLPMKR